MKKGGLVFISVSHLGKDPDTICEILGYIATIRRCVGVVLAGDNSCLDVSGTLYTR